MRSTARSAGSSTEPPWIFRLDRSCLGRFQGSVSPGAGDTVPDLWLKSSSSEKSAEDDMEHRLVLTKPRLSRLPREYCQTNTPASQNDQANSTLPALTSTFTTPTIPTRAEQDPSSLEIQRQN
ncbi:hypothetical protein BTVI_72563 [Pitangus sulphuratus]|nr:hypothetical protein BTVI_72563 [Pitangus sulphuratus]